MPIPDSARWRLEQRLELHRRHRWPDLTELNVAYRGNFAYVSGVTDGIPLKLCRLSYFRADEWGFAIYLASKEGYEKSILPKGTFTGTPEDTLDCACGLYLHDINAWIEADNHNSRKNF
jgi:hypothetical protein